MKQPTKHKAEIFEGAIVQEGCLPLEPFCVWCGRVRWGDYQPLGLGKWRHRECAPGSKETRDKLKKTGHCYR